MSKDKSQSVATIISNDTGEIIDEIYEGDSYKKICKEQKEYVNSHILNFNEGARFVKLFDEVLEDLSNQLSPIEFQFALRLAKHVSYNDCILRTNGNTNGKILDMQDISSLLNENYKTVNRIMNNLIKKGVLGKHITGCKEKPDIKISCYTCNPYIFMRGVNVNKTAENLFSNTGWAKISSK